MRKFTGINSTLLIRAVFRATSRKSLYLPSAAMSVLFLLLSGCSGGGGGATPPASNRTPNEQQGAPDMQKDPFSTRKVFTSGGFTISGSVSSLSSQVVISAKYTIKGGVK